jgi:translation initiation factor 3 subunit B
MKTNDKEPILEKEEYTEIPNLGGWLFDKNRDQYAIHYYDDYEVLWNEGTNQSTSVFKKKVQLKFKHSICQMVKTFCKIDLIKWSPNGTFITTWNKKGITIYGGDNFDFTKNFEHQNAKLIDYSPNESFIVTWNEDKKDVFLKLNIEYYFLGN